MTLLWLQPLVMMVVALLLWLRLRLPPGMWPPGAARHTGLSAAWGRTGDFTGERLQAVGCSGTYVVELRWVGVGLCGVIWGYVCVLCGLMGVLLCFVM